MTTDAKELREAIQFASRLMFEDRIVFRKELSLLIAAAEAHLASLPREVEIVRYVLIDGDGKYINGAPEPDAFSIYPCERPAGSQIVRLAGTALLPPQKD